MPGTEIMKAFLTQEEIISCGRTIQSVSEGEKVHWTGISGGRMQIFSQSSTAKNCFQNNELRLALTTRFFRRVFGDPVRKQNKMLIIGEFQLMRDQLLLQLACLAPKS